MSEQTTKRRTALFVSCTAHVVQDGLAAATYVLLPLLAQAFGFSYAQIGLFKGVKSLAQAILELYSGVLSERIGEGRTLIMGLVCAGIGYSMLATATEAAVAVACLVIVGVGSAFQHAPASAIVSTSFAVGGRRGALGLYNSSGDVGKLAFSGGFSLAVGAGLAWQNVALAYGLVAILAAAAIGVALSLMGRTAAREAAREPQPPQQASEEPRGWGILDRQSFSALVASVFLDNMVQAGTLVFVAFLMLEQGFPLYASTLAPVLVLAGGVFGKAGCGYLAERIGVHRAFALVQILTAAGLVGIVLVPGWLAFVLLPPLGVVAQGSTSITYGIVADLVHPRRMARGFALLYASTSFAAALGPFAFGLIGDRFEIAYAMIAMAAVAVLAVAPIVLVSNAETAPESAAS